MFRCFLVLTTGLIAVTYSAFAEQARTYAKGDHLLSLFDVVKNLDRRGEFFPGNDRARIVSQYKSTPYVFQVDDEVIVLVENDNTHIAILRMSDGRMTTISSRERDYILQQDKGQEVPFTYEHSRSSAGTSYNEVRSISSSCRGNFPYYYILSNDHLHELTSFYPVEVFHAPERLEQAVCLEGEANHPWVSYSATNDGLSAHVYLLSDQRILLNVFGSTGSFMVLLGQDLKLGTTLGGTLRLVEAAPINTWLAQADKGAAPRAGDPRAVSNFIDDYIRHHLN